MLNKRYQETKSVEIKNKVEKKTGKKTKWIET